MSSQYNYTEEIVSELGNIFDALDLLEENKIEIGSLETLAEMKDLLISKLNEVSDVPVQTEVDWFREIAHDHEVKKLDLMKIYAQLSELLLSLKEKPRDQIERQVPDCVDRLMQNNSVLAHKGCPILVAGETGAGKSSFLNLLIGEDILPVDCYESTTSTICEIKHSDSRYAVIHRKNGKDPINEKLDGRLDGVQKILNKYVNIVSDDRSQNEYELVEIFWPIPILQGNVYIVDSPGIGETESMNQNIYKYLPNAAAFIYIINSKNAGGVTDDRLITLIGHVKEILFDEKVLQRFDPRSAIFIFNKWDQVPEQSRDSVADNMTSKLQCWPGLDIDEQVFFLSITEVVRCRKQSIGMTKQYADIMHGLRKFLKTGLEISTRRHYNWLRHILDRIEMPLTSPIAAARRNKIERTEIKKKIGKQIHNLYGKSDRIIQDLEHRLKTEVDTIVHVLHEHLKCKSTRQRLFEKCTEYEGILPDSDEWCTVKDEIQNLVFKIINDEVTEWEKDKCMFIHAKSELVSMLKDRFHLLNSELERIEREIRGSSLMSVSTTSLRKFEKFGLFGYTEKAVLWTTAPLWFPLAILASVIALPVYGSINIFNHISHSRKMKKFTRDKMMYLQKEVSKYLDWLDLDAVKTTLVENHLVHLANYTKKCTAIIKRFLEADKELLDELDGKSVLWNTQTILDEYIPIYGKFRRIFSQLEVMHFRHYLHIDDEIFIDKDRFVSWGNRIGRGSFGDVYEAHVQINLACSVCGSRWEERKCAVKIIEVEVHRRSSQPLELAHEIKVLRSINSERHKVCEDCFYGDKSENISNQSHDSSVQTIQKPQLHEHIAKGSRNVIRLFGVHFQESIKAEVLLVMEYCKETLKDAIFNNSQRIPAKHLELGQEFKSAVEFFFKYAIRLTRGLMYIHDLQIIHRDLKLENILLTEDGQLKISDLGVAKPEKQITGTMKGTLAYLDPEILRGGLSTRPSDIYSLGLILWEMWYGCEVFADYYELGWQILQQDILDGVRPDFSQRRAPFCKLQDLMIGCWHNDPWKRFSDARCKKELKALRSIIDELTLPTL
ncbi:uncharacterized protein LOC141902645 [Tubulanus polymorphus]|uniref:uncharacterized protein LOC141902645 n=1 Tax=Tubulanus polymorphus TaxID=672921 RepID=UPI003DA3FE67